MCDIGLVGSVLDRTAFGETEMRFQMTREYFVPKGAAKVADKLSDAVAYIYTDKQGRPCSRVFYGKQTKPVHSFYHRNEAEREKSITRDFEARRAYAKRLAARREERKGEHTLVVGTVLRSSWGYDQTNIDFYEVTRLIGKHSVEIRKIGAESRETGWAGSMTGDCLPMEGKFIGDPMVKRANPDNSVKVRDWGVWARPWDGRIEKWTAYA
jgi:hypothetical protein